MFVRSFHGITTLEIELNSLIKNTFLKISEAIGKCSYIYEANLSERTSRLIDRYRKAANFL